MKKRRSLQLGFIIFIGCLAALYSSSSSRAQRANALTAQRALIEENCVVCHNQKSKTAGVSLQGLDFGNVGGDAALWEKVLRKVRTGQMPPPGRRASKRLTRRRSSTGWKARWIAQPVSIPIRDGPPSID